VAEDAPPPRLDKENGRRSVREWARDSKTLLIRSAAGLAVAAVIAGFAIAFNHETRITKNETEIPNIKEDVDKLVRVQEETNKELRKSNEQLTRAITKLDNL
jgi:cell division GTPase FtsZ